MTRYRYTHTNMSGVKTVRDLTIFGLIWQFSVLIGEKVEIEQI